MDVWGTVGVGLVIGLLGSFLASFARNYFRIRRILRAYYSEAVLTVPGMSLEEGRLEWRLWSWTMT